MKSRKYRHSRTISPNQILFKAKKEIQLQRQYKRVEQTMIFLQNSFSNNIQYQELYIDICKKKKDKISSKQLKMMYSFFGDNKANECIFEKISIAQIQRLKNSKPIQQKSLKKWDKYADNNLMDIIEEQENESQKKLEASDSSNQNSFLSKNRNSTKSRTSVQKPAIDLSQKDEDYEKETCSLMKRVYCRIVEKIFVKIAFYLLNCKYLDFISPNILELTKNLNIVIRRLKTIKDLRLLQHIITKTYEENMIIEQKIYEALLDGGYIMGMDEFYQINGVDAVHKDVFQRTLDFAQIKQELSQSNIVDKKQKQTLRQKLSSLRSKRQKAKVVKKLHIDKTNNQINQKYLTCISEIQQILKEDLEKEMQDVPTPHPQSKNREKIINNEEIQSTTQAYKVRDSDQKEDSQLLPRYSSVLTKENQQFRDSRDNMKAISRQKKYISKTSGRVSAFSNQFAMLISSASQETRKISRNSKVLSEKILRFNEYQKNLRKQSKNSRMSHLQSMADLHSQLKTTNKSQKISILGIQKLLKLYELRNSDLLGVDQFLGTKIKLSKQLNESINQQLVNFQNLDDSNSNKQSNRSDSFFKSHAFGNESGKLDSLLTDSKENSRSFQSYELCQCDQNQKEKKMKSAHVDPQTKICPNNNFIFTPQGFTNPTISKDPSHIFKKLPFKKLKNIQLNQKQDCEKIDLSPRPQQTGKLSKKAYRSLHNRFQPENHQISEKMSFNKDNYRFESCSIFKKLNSFHLKPKNFHNDTAEAQQSNENSQSFSVFQPRDFRFRSQQKPRLEQKKDLLIYKSKNKTFYKNTSEPISPKKNTHSQPSLHKFEIYDNRRKVKIRKYF